MSENTPKNETESVVEESQETVLESALEEQLAGAEAKAAEYLDGWQRSRAELSNYKRRTEAQRAEMMVSANANLLERLLPVLDDLQLALNNSPAAKQGTELATWQEWHDGIALIVHKFTSVLESVGVVPIETAGQSFDPTVHEAVSNEEHPELESGQIIAELRRGYKLGDRVLRAAMVRVAR